MRAVLPRRQASAAVTAKPGNHEGGRFRNQVDAKPRAVVRMVAEAESSWLDRIWKLVDLSRHVNSTRADEEDDGTFQLFRPTHPPHRRFRRQTFHQLQHPTTEGSV